jgi:hypothetical protein
VNCYIKKNCLDKDILKSIKSKADYFISERINLNPIRKLIDGRLIGLEYENDVNKIEYLTNYSNLEQKTSSVRIKDPLLNIPKLFDVVFSDIIFNQIKSDFEIIPIIEYVKIIKHFPNQYMNMVNDWHYDNFGKRGARVVLINLEDIKKIDEGPYSIVENSDKNRISNEKNVFNDEEVEKFYGKDFIKHLFANTGDVIFSKGDILHKSTKSINKEKTVLIINFEAKVDSDRSYPPDKIKLNKLDWYNIPFGRKELASNMEIV